MEKNELEKSKVNILFQDMTYASNYEFLEFGKDDDEIKEVAAKRGLVTPSKDLAIFKGRYAFVDRQNKNGCTLPRKEVKKALKTLNGKSVDKDHFRKSTVGYWLDSTLEDDEIISYGAFWKSNFPEDFEEIKKRMKEGKLKISFEAWGNREMTSDKTYNLNDIEFAGGAFLFDSEPAFSEAEVMEFATIMTEEEKIKLFTGEKTKKEITVEEMTISDLEKIEGAIPSEVLNKIKELTKKGIPMKDAMKQAWKEFKEEPKKAEIEESKLDFTWDKDTIARMMQECECPTCKMKGWHDIQNIDFEENKVKSRCPGCNGINMYDLTPSSTIVKKGKKLESPKALAKASVDNIEDFEGTDEELEMSLSEQIEGMDFIDEDLDEAKKKKLSTCKKLTYKERQSLSDDIFAVLVTVKNKKTGEPRKIRMFPLSDENHVRNALARLPQAAETLKKLGISQDTVLKKILKRAKELNMTDLLKRHTKGGINRMDELLKKYGKTTVEELAAFLAGELEIVKVELSKKDESITSLSTEKATIAKDLETVKASLETSKTELETIKVTLDKANADYKATKDMLDKKVIDEKANIVKTRKEELGPEFSKDLKDEDILDEVKFELAKTKKELATLKIKTDTKGLNGGSIEQGTKDPIYEKQASIQKKAFDEVE